VEPEAAQPQIDWAALARDAEAREALQRAALEADDEEVLMLVMRLM